MDPVVSVFGADVLWTLDEIVINVFVVFVTLARCAFVGGYSAMC